MGMPSPENLALVPVRTGAHPKSLFGRLLAIGALPLPATTDATNRTRRSHAGVSKHISDRELRRLQLPCLISALLPPAAPLEDTGGGPSSTNSNTLPLQQQALVVRGAATLVLQQWLLLAADVLLLLRRLLQPEKQQPRRSGGNGDQQQQLLRQQQQQDIRRKRVRTAEGDAAPEGEEPQEAEETAEAMWARTVELQQQQRQETDEESQQRLRRLGSVFASHLQAAESSVRAQRDSTGLLLQRGAPDLFSACWAAVATPLRSGGPRPLESLTTQQDQQSQQQVGSHERALAAATNGDGNAPGMSWRRWAFGGTAPHPPFLSAAAASSAAAEGGSPPAAAADVDEAAGESRAAQMEAADFDDMWGPLPEDELQEQGKQQAGEQPQEELLLQQDTAPLERLWGGQKAPRRKGGHLVQLDSAIRRSATRNITSNERAFPSLLRAGPGPEGLSTMLVAARYLAATGADMTELYALHPVACLYRRLQQQLLQSAAKQGYGSHTAAEATSAKARNAAGAAKPSSGRKLFGDTAASLWGGHQQCGDESTANDPAWQRGEWAGDFTLYTEAELHQQQRQQRDSSAGRRRSGELLESSEYVEVLRGIFGSSSLQQRATQARLAQLPRPSEGSSNSRLGSSRRTSGVSTASSEASLEAIAFGDFAGFEDWGSEARDVPQHQHQQQEHVEAHGAAVASLRLRELLQQYALRHPEVSLQLNSGATPESRQQQESRIPLSRLLPRGRVDPRTAACTFSHLLLLHTHGSIKLEQQQQRLHMPEEKPYAEVYVHITQLWGADVVAEAHSQQREEQHEEQEREEHLQEESRSLLRKSDAEETPHKR